MTLHILLDPSGAYLCLEYSLVCSHLESLLEKIRRNKPRRIEDPEKWRAYHDASPVTHWERTIGGAQVEVEVRQTERNVIMGRL